MDGRGWHKAGMFVVVFLMIAALAAIAAAGCSSANAGAAPLKLTDADNGKTFTVQVGDIITVVLPGNMTTGYSWASALGKQDAALLKQQGDAVYAPQGSNDGSLVGAGGTSTFSFEAAAAGRATLKLVYARPWESRAPAQTYEVQVTVK